MSQVIKLAIKSLKVHEKNTEFFDDIEGEQYERFKKSIKEDGVITPIIVAPDMTIISGHQRYKACKDLGISLIPSIIREDLEDEDEQLKKLLATNFGRMKNNPIKQGRVYEEYERLMGVRQGSATSDGKVFREKTQDDIAKELGVDARTLRNLKKLNQLSPELQQLIEDGQVKYTTALNVWGKLNNEEQAKFIEQMGREHISSLTAKETERAIKEKKEAERRVKELEQMANQQKQSIDKKDEQIRELRNRPPQTIEVEKVPEHIKDKLLDLEEEKKTLEERVGDLDKAKMEVNEYRKKKKEMEDEMASLATTMRKLKERYDEKEGNIAKQSYVINKLTTAISPLKKSKGELEQLFKDIDEMSQSGKSSVLSEISFLESMIDTLYKEVNKIETEVVFYE